MSPRGSDTANAACSMTVTWSTFVARVMGSARSSYGSSTDVRGAEAGSASRLRTGRTIDR
jgi:hypothetical protein